MARVLAFLCAPPRSELNLKRYAHPEIQSPPTEEVLDSVRWRDDPPRRTAFSVRPFRVPPEDRLAGDLEIVAATTACSPAAWARRHAQERLGLDPDDIDGSHYISLSRPREFADRLAAWAAETH